jgi:hypothetical protein
MRSFTPAWLTATELPLRRRRSVWRRMSNRLPLRSKPSGVQPTWVEFPHDGRLLVGGHFSVRSSTRSICPKVELSGHPPLTRECPLLGVKRTSMSSDPMSAFEPKRTWHRPPDYDQVAPESVDFAPPYAVTSCHPEATNLPPRAIRAKSPIASMASSSLATVLRRCHTSRQGAGRPSRIASST